MHCCLRCFCFATVRSFNEDRCHISILGLHRSIATFTFCVRFQLTAEGNFRVRWIGDILYSDNFAVGVSFKVGNPYGKLLSEGSRDYILVSYANYHPDSGQVFFPPPEQRPYIMLLARADVGDDVRPEHFQAFFFDGSVGFHIAPGVWHYSPYIQPPSNSGDKAEMVFNNKQGSVFACVATDTMKEFGVYLKVPLTLDA